MHTPFVIYFIVLWGLFVSPAGLALDFMLPDDEHLREQALFQINVGDRLILPGISDPLLVSQIIGHGNFGIVFEIQFNKTPAVVKIAFTKEEKHSEHSLLEQAKQLQSLSKGENSVLTPEVLFLDPRGRYLIMELINGDSLEVVVNNAESLSEKITVARQIAKFFDNFERRGLVPVDSIGFSDNAILSGDKNFYMVDPGGLTDGDTISVTDLMIPNIEIRNFVELLLFELRIRKGRWKLPDGSKIPRAPAIGLDGAIQPEWVLEMLQHPKLPISFSAGFHLKGFSSSVNWESVKFKNLKKRFYNGKPLVQERLSNMSDFETKKYQNYLDSMFDPKDYQSTDLQNEVDIRQNSRPNKCSELTLGA